MLTVRSPRCGDPIAPQPYVVWMSFNFSFFIFKRCMLSMWGRDSSVGIATRYRLDGPGNEFRCRRDIPHPSRPTVGPPSFLYSGHGVFLAGKAAGAWR